MTLIALKRRSPTASTTTPRPAASCPSSSCNGNAAHIGSPPRSLFMGRGTTRMGVDHSDSIYSLKRFSDLEFHLPNNLISNRRYTSLDVLGAVGQALAATIAVWVTGRADTLIVYRQYQQVGVSRVHPSSNHRCIYIRCLRPAAPCPWFSQHVPALFIRSHFTVLVTGVHCNHLLPPRLRENYPPVFLQLRQSWGWQRHYVGRDVFGSF